MLVSHGGQTRVDLESMKAMLPSNRGIRAAETGLVVTVATAQVAAGTTSTTAIRRTPSAIAALGTWIW